MGLAASFLNGGVRVERQGARAASNTIMGFCLSLDSADMVKDETGENIYLIKGVALSAAEGVSVNQSVTVKMSQKIGESTLFHGMPRSLLPAVTEGSPEKHAKSEILVRGWVDNQGIVQGTLGTAVSTLLTNNRLLGAKPTSKVPQRDVSTMLLSRPILTLVDGDARVTLRFDANAVSGSQNVRVGVQEGKAFSQVDVPFQVAVQQIRETITKQLAINQEMIDRRVSISPVIRVDTEMFDLESMKTFVVAPGTDQSDLVSSLTLGQYLLEGSDGKSFSLSLTPGEEDAVLARKKASAIQFIQKIGSTDDLPAKVTITPFSRINYAKEVGVKMAEAYANMLQNQYDPVDPRATWSLASTQRPNLRGWESMLKPSFHGLEKPFTPAVVSMVLFDRKDKVTGAVIPGFCVEKVLAQTSASFDTVVEAAAEIARISYNPNEELEQAPSNGADNDYGVVDAADFDVSGMDAGSENFDFDPAMADALGEPAAQVRRTRNSDLGM